jgi:hypothetical protein
VAKPAPVTATSIVIVCAVNAAKSATGVKPAPIAKSIRNRSAQK